MQSSVSLNSETLSKFIPVYIYHAWKLHPFTTSEKPRITFEYFNLIWRQLHTSFLNMQLTKFKENKCKKDDS